MRTRSNYNRTLSGNKRTKRYTPYQSNRRTSFTNNHFQVWKNRIDNYVYNKIGWNLDDLPDQPYRQWFEDGYLKPHNVVHIVLSDYYQLYNANCLYFS